MGTTSNNQPNEPYDKSYHPNSEEMNAHSIKPEIGKEQNGFVKDTETRNAIFMSTV